jgi:hypothetical protein
MKSYGFFLSLLALLPVFHLQPVWGQQNPSHDPVMSVDPSIGNFSAVFPGESRTLEFTLRNVGYSVLKIKQVEVKGDSYSLTDNNTYPFEILSDSAFPFPGTNNGKWLKFTVEFHPAATGNLTGQVIVTYGLYGDSVRIIELDGISLDCDQAVEAHPGVNESPGLNTWFKYTADKYSMVTIDACDSGQPNPQGNPSLHLFFTVYDGCGGPVIPEIDEWTGTCPYDPDAIPVQKMLDPGQTVYIFWPGYYPDSPYDTTGFKFNIQAYYPPDGDVCENAIPLTLPVVNLFGSTGPLHDDYDISPCSAYPNYLSGNDGVYTITTDREGYLNGDILGTYASIHVLDACPKEELGSAHCIAFTGGPEGGQFHRKIPAGTYFVIISGWAPPQSIDYLLNMSWEDASSVESAGLEKKIDVFPNPAQTSVSLSVSQAESLPLTIELIDLTGRTVYREITGAVMEYREDIDVGSLARGVYYLKVNNGRELSVRKVILD